MIDGDPRYDIVTPGPDPDPWGAYSPPSDWERGAEWPQHPNDTKEARAGYHVAFTGTRKGMTPGQRAAVSEHLSRLKAEHGHIVFHYGACTGADQEAAEIAQGLSCDIVAHPSNIPSTTAPIPHGATVRSAKPPLERNRDIVAAAQLLLAAPKEATEELRSGTWATVRYAREAGIPVQILPPNHKRSVSQLTSFARCGEAYRLEKIARAPRAPAAWFTQGVAVHSAIEYYERWRCEDEASVDRALILARYFAEYDRMIAEDREREPDLSAWLTGGRTRAEVDIERRRERGADMVTRYMAYADAAPERPFDIGGGEAAVEVPFEIELGGVTVVGAIDMILVWPDGSLTPRDLKSGSKRPEWGFQLGVYAIAVEELFGVRPEYGDFYMLKDDRPDLPVPLSRFTRETLGEWFRALDAGVEHRVFVPNPGDACRTCGVRPYCSAMGGLYADMYPPKVNAQTQAV